MRRLFQDHFFKSLTNSYCKSFVNIMELKGSYVYPILLRLNRECVDGANYQVVPRFFLFVL